MVIYDSKKWVGSLSHFYRSHVMQQIFKAVVFMGLYATVAVVVAEDVIKANIRFNSGIFSLLGIVLSIVLVFRTNSAYDRWWEGRKYWGELVNHSRSMAMQLKTIIPPDDYQNQLFFCNTISSYARALKEHLRNGVQPGDLNDLTPGEQSALQGVIHIPNRLLLQLYQRISQLHRRGIFTESELRNLKPHLDAFANITGACERIKKTPIPFSYNNFIKTYISFYCLLLPIGLLPDFKYFTIPIVMFIFYAFIGLELMAEEIEEPFGLDCNDLPIGEIAITIRNNVQEIFDLNVETRHLEKAEKLYEKIF